MKTNIEKFQVKSSAFIRLMSLTFILVIILPATLSAQAGKSNFAGSWTLNAEKSTQPQGGPGGGMRMGGGDFVATQDANLLTVVRSFPGQDGQPMSMTMKYTLDGKESVNSSGMGDSKSIAKWSADGKTLTIETSRTFDMGGESRTMKSSEAWVLTDAKTLTITSTRTGRDGNEVKTVNVYNMK